MKKLFFISLCLFSVYFFQSCQNEEDPTTDRAYEIIASEEYQEFTSVAKAFSEQFMNNYLNLSVEQRVKVDTLLEELLENEGVTEKYEELYHILNINLTEEFQKIETVRSPLLYRLENENISRKDLMIASKKYELQTGSPLLKSSSENNENSACIEACNAAYIATLIGCMCIPNPIGTCACLAAASYAQTQCIKACK